MKLKTYVEVSLAFMDRMRHLLKYWQIAHSLGNRRDMEGWAQAIQDVIDARLAIQKIPIVGNDSKCA